MNLANVADAVIEVMQQSAEDFINTADDVDSYCYYNMGVSICDEHAKMVLSAAKAWIKGLESGIYSGHDDFYRVIIEPLQHYEVKNFPSMVLSHE